MKSENTVMHIDVNSAFLSWHTAYYKQIGIKNDFLETPTVIGGNEKKRHGIVLAKSIPAKKSGVKTGQSLMEARSACPNLKIIHPRYDVYIKASKSLREFLKTYTPDVDVFSIDECFLNFIDKNKDYKRLAYEIKNEIKKNFGYTVNIGISNNKLLAKQASEFEKPDKIHTLYKEEIKTKLWPLDISELYMIGRRTVPKLKKLGISTIGDLANCDYNLLVASLKSHGKLIYDYSWGIDNSIFKEEHEIKGIGNGSTISFDVEERQVAYKIIMSLCENVGIRLRKENKLCKVVSIGIKNKDFKYSIKQKKINYYTSSTEKIIETAKYLFDELWDQNPIRHMNVRISDFIDKKNKQINFFEKENTLEKEKLDEAIDKIREKYGSYSIIRASYIDSGIEPIMGGYPSEEYPDMKSIL
ncbi:MAG: DNA polymerase IV [Bacillota bacterium]|nr:DNA polymerase IV [Bacillota bacterium]